MNAIDRAISASSSGEFRTNRPPARVAASACSRGSVSFRTGTAVTATAPITNRKETAFAENTTAALLAASSAPPIAGPTARARFWFTEPSAIAWGRASAGTSSGCSVCQVAAPAAPPAPITNSSASSAHGVTQPAAAKTASAADTSKHHATCVTVSRRRSTRSPRAPAGTASSKTGMLPAAGIALSSNVDDVSEVITHCAATVCIHEPTLLVN